MGSVRWTDAGGCLRMLFLKLAEIISKNRKLGLCSAYKQENDVNGWKPLSQRLTEDKWQYGSLLSAAVMFLSQTRRRLRIRIKEGLNTHFNTSQHICVFSLEAFTPASFGLDVSDKITGVKPPPATRIACRLLLLSCRRRRYNVPTTRTFVWWIAAGSNAIIRRIIITIQWQQKESVHFSFIQSCQSSPPNWQHADVRHTSVYKQVSVKYREKRPTGTTTTEHESVM